ncbi:MAG: HEAT repeat domain-containing protein [Phototrophicaceae bacterium]|jgi:HEAT repeat protein
MEDNTLQHLLQQLADGEDTVRYDAAQQLGEPGNEAAVDGLVNLLNDENPKVRYAALSSLVKIGSLKAAQPTITALLEDLESRLWKLMALDIGMRLRNGLFAMIVPGDTQLAELLVNALENYELDDSQRALIVRLIGRAGDLRLFDTFVDMMMIGSETLQGAAAEALGYLGDARGVTPLLTVLEDANSKVREIAIDALGRIGDSRAGDALLPLLNSADEWTRRAAATSLGQLNDKRAVRPLLRMSREDESQVVREAADKALKRLITSGSEGDGLVGEA